ncbi:MAG: TolC family protein [Bacteroidales bacterium]|nr:TolC family protein [Bacteroidales bacterium]
MKSKTLFLFLMITISLSAQEMLTLQDCKTIAIRENLSLSIDSIKIKSAIHTKRAAFANYFPDISFAGTFLHLNKQFQLFENDILLPVVPHQAIDLNTMHINQESFSNPMVALLSFAIDPSTLQPLTDVNGNPVFRNYAWLPADQSKFGLKDNYLFNFSLKQPIFVGGKIFYSNKMANNSVEIAKYKTEMDKQNLLYEIEDMYYKTWIIDKKCKLAHKYLELLQEIEKDIKNYIDEGIATTNQLLMIQTKINQAQVNLFKAENGLTIQKQLLNQKMGRDIHQDFSLVDTIDFDINIIHLIINENLDINNRPEIKLLEQKVELSQNMLRVTQADMLPQIGFMANYFFVNPNPYKGFANEFGDDYTFGVSIQIPIFHALERYNKRQAALLQYKAAQIEMNDIKNLISIETSYTTNQLKEQLMQLNATNKNVELARENLRVQTDLFMKVYSNCLISQKLKLCGYKLKLIIMKHMP